MPLKSKNTTSMKKTFIIISVSDRIQQLNELVRSIIHLGYEDYEMALYFQDYEGNRIAELEHPERFSKIIVTDKKVGCHAARVLLLREVKSDVYINLDDDMLLTQYTRYDKAIEKALEPHVGFVLTNWARTPKLLLEKVPKMSDTFKSQIMCYQGGGMVYSDKIAELIRPLPAKKYMFDDLWAMTSYINGYTNYQYAGSLALHFICTKGGMRKFMAEEKPPYACAEYINYRTLKNGEYAIGLDSDVNDYAKALHKKNLKR